MSAPQAIDVQDLDHLGIIAGIVDEIGIVEIVDALCGTHEQENVSCGQVVKALILNGMGFLSAPLYLFSQFFAGKATDHILGPGVRPEHLNDVRIGRVLDKLYTFGVTNVFMAIAVAVVQKFEIALKCAHLDATSLSVAGQYLGPTAAETPAEPTCESNAAAPDNDAPQPHIATPEPDDPIPIQITYGYSRDHRRDLKQFVLDLIASGDSGIPLFLAVGNGNDADKATFVPIIQQFQQQWQHHPPEVFVADSALYSAANLAALGPTPWISRVPASLTQAQALLQGLVTEQFQPSAISGYTVAAVCTTYGDIRQRWLVIESTARKDADLKKLHRSIAKALRDQTAALKTLQTQVFACHDDALTAAQAFEKLKYHSLTNLEIQPKPHHGKAGRPAKGAVPTHYTYPTFRCSVSPVEN